MDEFHCYIKYWVLALLWMAGVRAAAGLSCNWGLQSTHPLPPDIVVKLMKDNGFTKVKLFEAEPGALKALGRSGIQVMVGIPNELLALLADSVSAAEDWVQKNVSLYISQYGVDIRHVAVGNEPFLKSYKDKFLQTTFPALKNIQAALTKAGLSRQVKVTVPLNADVYQTATDLPSGGDFRSDIHTLVVDLVLFLSQNGAPLTINIYPFLSLYADPNFPVDYAFFSGSTRPVVDGNVTYNNAFDANFDTLIWALEKNGLGSVPVIVGEVGWPSDGDRNANPTYARRFNQGMIDRIADGRGTPKRAAPPEVYFFGLIDEDAKSVLPGNFERHWGIFAYDGTVKYQLDLRSGGLTAAKDVRYLQRRWCVAAPGADIAGLAPSVDYACSNADCTSLGLGSSCGKLDSRGNASYAFNSYFQAMNQRQGTCEFANMSEVTKIDPSQDGCRFGIMIDQGEQEKTQKRGSPPPFSGAEMHKISAAERYKSSAAMAIAAAAMMGLAAHGLLG